MNISSVKYGSRATPGMRILIVTSIFPPDIGGPATYVPIIAEGLTRRGHRIHTLTRSQGKNVQREPVLYPVDRIDRRRKKPARFLEIVQKTLRAGKKKDLIFFNGLQPEALMVSTLLNIPIIAKVVGDVVWERATRLKWIVDDFDTFQRSRYTQVIEGLRSLRNLSLRRMNRIITPSDYLKQTILSWGVKKDRITVIPNAVSAHSPEKNSEFLQMPQKGFFNILYAGRLAVHKRVDQIIRALTNLPNVTLTVLGEGPEKENLEKLADRLGVLSRVNFWDSCSQTQMIRVLKNHQCLVLNSTYEGFPHIVLEAQSAGTPIMATATGGTRELVSHRETGWLIDLHEEVDGIIRGLRKLSASPGLCRRLARNARKSVAKYSVKNMVETTEKLLMRVVEHHR